MIDISINFLKNAFITIFSIEIEFRRILIANTNGQFLKVNSFFFEVLPGKIVD